MIYDILANYTENSEFQLSIDVNLARSFAKCSAIPRGKALSVDEMKILIDELFGCEAPFTNPTGHKTFVKQELEDIKRLFQ
jgi:DNA mismatch repair protein MutL